jgi:hypothetical protein
VAFYGFDFLWGPVPFTKKGFLLFGIEQCRKYTNGFTNGSLSYSTHGLDKRRLGAPIAKVQLLGRKRMALGFHDFMFPTFIYFLAFQIQDGGMGLAFIESCLQRLWGWAQEGHELATQYTLAAAPVAAVTRRQHSLLRIVVLVGDVPSLVLDGAFELYTIDTTLISSLIFY